MQAPWSRLEVGWHISFKKLFLDSLEMLGGIFDQPDVLVREQTLQRRMCSTLPWTLHHCHRHLQKRRGRWDQGGAAESDIRQNRQFVFLSYTLYSRILFT